jgi:hypothetical protein
VKKNFDPYENESDSLEIDGLTIENRVDKVSVYGSIDITRDKKGLTAAKELARLLDAVVRKLSSEELPDSIPPPEEPDTIKNPFE